MYKLWMNGMRRMVWIDFNHSSATAQVTLVILNLRGILNKHKDSFFLINAQSNCG